LHPVTAFLGWRDLSLKGESVFCLTKVPYIARVIEYGHHAELKGYKNEIKVTVFENENKEAIREAMDTSLGIRTVILRLFWAAALTNSSAMQYAAPLYILFNINQFVSANTRGELIWPDIESFNSSHI
jgi:hypothetical protein